MQQKLERYIQLCGNMLLPCLIFVIGLFGYLWSSHLNYDNALIFHYGFLAVNVVLLLIIIYFNQGRSIFVAVSLFAPQSV